MQGMGSEQGKETVLGPGAARREMTRQQYLLFLLLPPLLLALMQGASMFGSARFENRMVHIAYALASILPGWLMMELGSVIAAALLRPWRPALWVLLVVGVMFASLAHAPFTLLRDPLFVPHLKPDSSLFPSWPWNFTDQRYAMESALAMLGRMVAWLPLNYVIVHALGFRRLGAGHFFLAEDEPRPRSSPGLPDERPGLALLLRRLPPDIGHDILCLKAQEHYTNVITTGGQALVYMRFSDAVGLASAGMAGVQIHRSYWVALAAIRNFERVDGRIIVRLVNGETLPVSRSHQGQLRGLKSFMQLA
jgi:hypothetical protein